MDILTERPPLGGEPAILKESFFIFEAAALAAGVLAPLMIG